MDQDNTVNRIDRMIKIIENEALDEVSKIREEATSRAQKQKIKQVNTKRDQIDTDFDKKRKNFKVQQRLEKSKKINETRLEVQTKRNDLLTSLKDEVKQALVERMRNRGEYETVLGQLIIQGLVRLLERSVKIRVQKKDVDLAKGLLKTVKSKFTEFVKEELKKEITVNLEVDQKRFIPESELGGCILICGKGKILYTNTLASRLDLAFYDSFPLIRKNLFPSLN